MMSTSYCISCDLEICRHQLHFDPMLARPYDHQLPDEWITLVKGDPQINKAWHFCSYHCLSEWISLEREKERKAELENMHRLEAEDKKIASSQRHLTLILKCDLLAGANRDAYIHARARTVYELFTDKFPEGEELDETVHHLEDVKFIDWRYTLADAYDEHIEWAKLAKECGLIDHYVVDEVPAHGNG